MDGMLYISVSKNLADGLGNFWEPHFSKTVMPVFQEQPPLYFGLLALFYKIFGTSMYVERLFCFTCLLFTLFFIHKIWKNLFANDETASKNSWLPLLFFITIPVCFWAYSNHVEETVMTLFATMAVYYTSNALFRKENIIFNLILAGICVFLSSLTKGIQGLFPITAVFFYWLINKNLSFKKNILYSVVLVGTPVFIYALLIVSNNHIYDIFKMYFENRLGKAFVTGEHNTTDNHFEIGIRLFTELIPMFGLMLIIFLINLKFKTQKEEKTNNQKLYWLLLIGFSGALPLMTTLEQRGFYLVTSFPLFALAGAVFVSNKMKFLIEKINLQGSFYKYSKWIMSIVLLFSTIYTFSKVGETKRDKELLHDVYAIGKVIPKGEIVCIPNEIYNDWNFQTYMVRFNYISLKASNNGCNYFITRKDLSKDLVPKEYELDTLKTEFLDVYILKK